MATEPTSSNGHDKSRNMMVDENPPATTANYDRLNDWFARSFANCISPHVHRIDALTNVIEVSFEKIGEECDTLVTFDEFKDTFARARELRLAMVKEIQEEREKLKELSADFKILDRQLIAEVNKRDMMDTRTIEDLNQVRRDVSGLIGKADDTARAIQRVSKNSYDEIQTWIKRIDRQFVSEVDRTRDMLIAKNGEYMNVMKEDVKSVLRAVLRDELVDTIIKMRSDIYKEMFEDLRLEIRRELRSAEARRIMNARKKPKPKPQQSSTPKKK